MSGVFGSVARGEAGPDSDVDFLVEMEKGRSLFDLGGLLMDPGIPGVGSRARKGRDRPSRVAGSVVVGPIRCDWRTVKGRSSVSRNTRGASSRPRRSSQTGSCTTRVIGESPQADNRSFRTSRGSGGRLGTSGSSVTSASMKIDGTHPRERSDAGRASRISLDPEQVVARSNDLAADPDDSQGNGSFGELHRCLRSLRAVGHDAARIILRTSSGHAMLGASLMGRRISRKAGDSATRDI